MNECLHLVALEETDLTKAITDLVAGEQVNNSEKQSALHIGLRHSDSCSQTGQYDSVFDQLKKMVEVERSIREGNRRGFTKAFYRHSPNRDRRLAPRLKIPSRSSARTSLRSRPNSFYLKCRPK